MAHFKNDPMNAELPQTPSKAATTGWKSYARQGVEQIMPGLNADDARWLVEQLSPRTLLKVATSFVDVKPPLRWRHS